MVKDKEQKVRYAYITDRLFASMIDVSLIFVLILPIALYVAPDFFSNADLNFEPLYQQVLNEYPELEGNDEAILEKIFTEHTQEAKSIIGKYIYRAFLQIMLIGLILVPFIWKKGATPGKMLLGLTVVDSITFEKLSLNQAIIRFLSYIPSVGFLFIGMIWGGIHKRKRCLHDIFADTVVIYDPNRWYMRLINKLRDRFAKKD